jgi:glutamate transport system substrate-binding protein
VWTVVGGVASVGALVLALLTAIPAISRPPTTNDLKRRAGLTGMRQLLVGVRDDQPGIALRDPATATYSGFEIDVALLIAADLGFSRQSVVFLPFETKDVARMQARTAEGTFVTVTLVIAGTSITAERSTSSRDSFSAPYLATTQSVLTRSDHAEVESLTDLRGQRVCAIDLAEWRKQAVQPTVADRISECVAGLRARKLDAVSAEAAILAGFAHAYPAEFRMHDIGVDADERWGVYVGDNDALRSLVNLSLYHSRYDPADHRWEAAFDANLRPEQADALPQQVAIAQQPDVPKVPVRE